MVEAAGVRVLDQTFYAQGSLASAGGCLASPYLAAWVITKGLGRAAAEAALQYVAPVGEAQRFIAGILDVVELHVVADPALTALA